MDEKIYKVTLADGTVIDGLKMNGNNFISLSPIDVTVFDGNCYPVIINNGETDEVHENMELVQVTKNEAGEYWFVLRDISEKELAQVKMQSDIEYIAMMAGVELYEEGVILTDHSKNYSKVKRWHDMGMWNNTRVHNAVVMGWITEEEFTEITGQAY